MTMSEPSLPRTKLSFHRDGKLRTHKTNVLSLQSLDSLAEADRSLIKPGSLEPFPTHALIVESTIFHPQGGGQPSDTGSIVIPSHGSEDGEAAFEVSMVRHAVTAPSLVLHFGNFKASLNPDSFPPGTQIEQRIDWEKRLLYSRLHTAGHVLGATVRNLLEHKIEGFDELKASHFPDSAACEFRGLIPGDQKAPIQAKLEEYVAAHMPVQIEFWSKDDFRRNKVERLIPGDEEWDALKEGDGEGTIRVVNIVGAEVYPCGGTHVDYTDDCGKVTVRKIGRSKGTSRVGYAVD